MTPGTHPDYHQLLATVRAVFSEVWLPGWGGRQMHHESPAEDILAIALDTLLWREIQRGRLLITRQAPIDRYRVDFLLSDPRSGAHGAIEVDGRRYHRRSARQFEEELRRERLIQQALRCPLIRYSAREVLRAPWTTAVDIVGLLGRTWNDFDPVILPARLLEPGARGGRTGGRGVPGTGGERRLP